MSAQASDRYCGEVERRAGAGRSSVADAFGASVSIPMDGQSLFLVVGREGSPDSAVAAVGGVVVTRLPGGQRLLAFCPLRAYGELQRHAAVALAGPVSIDAERFGRFAQLIGLDGDRTDKPP